MSITSSAGAMPKDTMSASESNSRPKFRLLARHPRDAPVEQVENAGPQDQPDRLVVVHVVARTRAHSLEDPQDREKPAEQVPRGHQVGQQVDARRLMGHPGTNLYPPAPRVQPRSGPAPIRLTGPHRKVAWEKPSLAMTEVAHPEINSATTMRALLADYPGAQRALFAKYHIGGCRSCAFQPAETLGEVCARNENLPVDEVIAHIRESHDSDASPPRRTRRTRGAPRRQESSPPHRHSHPRRVRGRQDPGGAPLRREPRQRDLRIVGPRGVHPHLRPHRRSLSRRGCLPHWSRLRQRAMPPRRHRRLQPRRPTKSLPRYRIELD